MSLQLPFQQELPRLPLAIVGDAAYDYMAAVALSADARTLVVGASGWNNVDSEGYVKVYRADEDG